MSGSHVDPNESIDLEEVSALAHEYAADSPDKKKDNNNADNSNTNDNNNDDNNDTPTAATSASTPTKEVYVNSPSPQTTNNRTPSPVAQAKAQFELQGSPPSISRSTPPKAASGSGLAEMPPKKNALFSQWQAKTANSAPIDFSKKNVGVTSPTNGGRVPYTGKRWSPPKAAGSSSSSNKPFNVNDVGAVSASAALLINKGSPSQSTPPLPPKPVVKTPPRTSNTPPTLLRRDGSTVVATTTSSSPAIKKQTKNIDEIESSLDDLRELKEQLRLATAAAGSGVIEVSPDKFTKNKDIDTKADIQGLKEDIDNDWKEKKEKVKMLKKGEHRYVSLLCMCIFVYTSCWLYNSLVSYILILLIVQK